MSERKSWDITPNRRPPARPAQPVSRAQPARRFEDIRPAPKKAERAPQPSARPSASVPTRREAARKPGPAAPRTPLSARRKQARRRSLQALLIAVAVLLLIAEALLWQGWLRISTVDATGPAADAIKAFVQKDLSGTRFLIVPKNSIFFVPERQIRADVLAAFPAIEAVSIHPEGLTALSIESTRRASVLWWCGTATDAPSTSCYQADAQGLVFAEVPLDQRFATDSALTLYAPLAKEPANGSPVGDAIANSQALPQVIQFVKAMRSLGANVVSVAIRGDEADLYTAAGTRITYVIGREEQAANLAAAGFGSLNLNDGSLEYVDLRFESKIFFKKK